MKKLIIFLLIVGIVPYIYKTSSDQDIDPEIISMMEVPSSFPIDSSPGIKQITSTFPIESLIEKGRYTIIEFYNKFCGACKALGGHYNRFLAVRKDVSVKRIVIGKYWKPSQLERDYGKNVQGTPHLMIYSPDGNLIAEDNGNSHEGKKLLYKWMDAELKKVWDKEHQNT